MAILEGGERVNQMYRSNWWSIKLPSGWIAKTETDCVSISTDPPLGVLQISAARNIGGPVTLRDLDEFACDAEKPDRVLEAIEIQKISGIYTEYEKGELFWREWWLREGATMVYLTYNVSSERSQTERDTISRMVNSISIFDQSIEKQ